MPLNLFLQDVQNNKKVMNLLGDSKLLLENSEITFCSEENFNSQTKKLTSTTKSILTKLPPTKVVIAGTVA